MCCCRRRFRDFSRSRGKKRDKETSFCNQSDWGEAYVDFAARGQFVLGITRLLPPLIVIICVCLPPASFLGRRKGTYLASGQARHVNDIQTRLRVGPSFRPVRPRRPCPTGCQRGRTFIPCNTLLGRSGSRRCVRSPPSLGHPVVLVRIDSLPRARGI